MKLIIDIDNSDYERIKDLVAEDPRYTTATTVGTAYQAIASGIPYEERPQGEWEVHGMIHYCSNCGHDCGESGDNFCGNCGADMRNGGAV